MYLLTTDPDFFDLAGWQAHLAMLERHFPGEEDLIGMALDHIALLEQHFASTPKKTPVEAP